MTVEEKYKSWIKSELVSKEDVATLKAMSVEQKQDAFYKDIEFGTAGMRGVMGPGSNRLNFFTILKAAVSFGEYLIKKFPDARERGVVIAHDNRFNSPEFCNETAEILSVNGIKVYVFDDARFNDTEDPANKYDHTLRPTPELSYAVRELNCVGGIVITASHNPKQYNGFKVYDETGCQLVPDQIQGLLDIIATKPNELEIIVPEYEPHGQVIKVGKELDDKYVEQVLSIRLNPDVKKEGYKIVYTPQHGTSYVNAMRVFKEAGYEIVPVTEQCVPDPAFSKTLTPNPEDPKAYDAALKLAKEIQAPLIVMTDPDADRVGVAYKSSTGEYKRLTGNNGGAMLLDYVLSQRKAKGLLSRNGVMFNTIVTSGLGQDVASFYGVKTVQTLTGFKYIGEQIHKCELNGNNPHFEFGYEESYGALIAPFARDKDGLQAILLYCEMACFYAEQGKCLDEVLYEIQNRIGHFYKDVQYSTEFKGAEGAKKMADLMARLRNNPLKEVNRTRVNTVEDYLTSVKTENGMESTLKLPKADVLKYILDDNSTIAIRPSGTEPKCKFYIGAVSNDSEEVDTKPQKIYLWLKNFLKL